MRDRSKAVVAGTPVEGGGLMLYEINLKTGENRQLGGDALASGMTMFPVLSPDGKTVAVLHKGATEGILESQIYLVEIASGEARPIGKPMDTAFLSWLPGGDGFILVSRDTSDMTKPSLNSVAKMDLDGKVTVLRRGNEPILLNDGKTILFRDDEDRRWMTCDLDGKNEKLFGDGLQKYARPAPSPDGKRVLMFLTGDKERGLVPTIIDMGESRGKPATQSSGLWLRASWR